MLFDYLYHRGFCFLFRLLAPFTLEVRKPGEDDAGDGEEDEEEAQDVADLESDGKLLDFIVIVIAIVIVLLVVEGRVGGLLAISAADLHFGPPPGRGGDGGLPLSRGGGGGLLLGIKSGDEAFEVLEVYVRDLSILVLLERGHGCPG